jgi:hypothetical protein
MMRHGIRREAFLCPMASNAMKILKTGKGRPNISTLLSASEVARLGVERWMIPRAERRPEYREWKVEQLIALLGPQKQIGQPRLSKAI